jgi:hypothetical protein
LLRSHLASRPVLRVDVEKDGVHKGIQIVIGRVSRCDHASLSVAFFREAGTSGIGHPYLNWS